MVKPFLENSMFSLIVIVMDFLPYRETSWGLALLSCFLSCFTFETILSSRIFLWGIRNVRLVSLACCFLWVEISFIFAF